MLFSLLAWTACVADEVPMDPREEVFVAAPLTAASDRIAIRPHPAPPRRAPIIASDLPAGEPRLNHCFATPERRPTSGGGALFNRASPSPPPAPSMSASRPRPEAKMADAASAQAPVELDDADVRNKEANPAPAPEREEVAADALLEDFAALPDRRRGADWGASVYLSNDDSMSLASAQRVLFGLSHRVGLSVGEVRPHELLNYFSFDTAQVARSRSFSVLGAAERVGDTLTMSLAVKGANPPRGPLDLTVLLDRSGSMQGEGRMAYTKRGLTLLTEQLQRGDRVDVVLFDSGVCTPIEGYVVGRDDPAMLSSVIDQLRPMGSTNLSAGLDEAYRIQSERSPKDVRGRNRRVMLITDAQLNTGNVNQDIVSQVGGMFDDHGIRLTGIGVGRDFNDKMLDLLTEKGKGAYVYLGSEAVVDRIFGPGFDSLTRTLAHDVRFRIDLPDSLAMERFYGEEASTNAEDIQPINYYAGTSQLFLQDLTMRNGRAVRSDPVVLHIEYRDAVTGEPGIEELSTTVGALLDGDAHNLRKGQALMAFSDVVLAQAMGADHCGEPLRTFRQRAGRVTGDAEIAYVAGLLGDACGVNLASAVPAGVPFKVRVDADQAIPEVSLLCNDSAPQRLQLSGSDTVASFEVVSPGACTVTLQGRVPMTAALEVPSVGGAVRCVVRGGRLSCS